MKRGWKPMTQPKPATRRYERKQKQWIELYLPAVCADDVLAVVYIDIESHLSMREWDWWREQYAAMKPPNNRI